MQVILLFPLTADSLICLYGVVVHLIHVPDSVLKITGSLGGPSPSSFFGFTLNTYLCGRMKRNVIRNDRQANIIWEHSYPAYFLALYLNFPQNCKSS